jgi:hypothetical protein
VSGTELHRLADLDCDGVADFAMGAAGRWEYQVGDHENALLVSGASLEPLGVVSPDLLRQGRRVAPLRR